MIWNAFKKEGQAKIVWNDKKRSRKNLQSNQSIDKIDSTYLVLD